MWYIKQLLPLHYHTHYVKDGVLHFVSWRMWFGKVFNTKERTWELK